MYAAFPRPEYYGGSAPPAPSAGVAPIPARPFLAGRRARNARGWFPRSLSSGQRIRHPALPLRPRQRLLRGNSPWPPGKDHADPARSSPPRHEGAGAHRNPARIHRIRAGDKSRGVTQPVPRVYLSVSLTAPGPSGSAEPARLCRGCSRPPRRPPDQAASSFTPPPRRQGDGRSLTSIRKRQRLVAHARSYQDRLAWVRRKRWCWRRAGGSFSGQPRVRGVSRLSGQARRQDQGTLQGRGRWW